jgi:hypothetical protein
MIQIDRTKNTNRYNLDLLKNLNTDFQTIDFYLTNTGSDNLSTKLIV